MYGLQSGVVKIMHGYVIQDNTLCSPTSALEKKQMLSRLGEELRIDESFLMDSDKFIVGIRRPLFAGRGPTTCRHERHDNW
jgi:hypothetical protein